MTGNGVGIQTGNSGQVQVRQTDAQDNAAVAMDSGVAQGGTNNANANAGALAVSNPVGSPIANNSSKAIGSVAGDAAVGMDSANVVSTPSDSAIAQGAGGIALNNTDHFAVSQGSNSPAIQDANDVAFVGAGASAQDLKDSTVAQQGITSPTRPSRKAARLTMPRVTAAPSSRTAALR